MDVGRQRRPVGAVEELRGGARGRAGPRRPRAGRLVEALEPRQREAAEDDRPVRRREQRVRAEVAVDGAPRVERRDRAGRPRDPLDAREQVARVEVERRRVRRRLPRDPDLAARRHPVGQGPERLRRALEPAPDLDLAREQPERRLALEAAEPRGLDLARRPGRLVARQPHLAPAAAPLMAVDREAPAEAVSDLHPCLARRRVAGADAAPARPR
ncbi:MAG: hypothetical protein M9894_20130 [Planctomycetes bacterium]|nr:hypothetical protein [Planctomycetota bacterium]